jgi:hypothetical protein
MRFTPGTRALAAALALCLAGCSHLHWPWHRTAPAPPGPVHELEVSGAAADTYPQYWKRNTLLVDLSGASGSGSLTLRPPAGNTWPVRLAFRVTPGSIGVLEVRGAQRDSLPIAASGKPIDLEISPGVYPPGAHELVVSWGPKL